MQENLGIIIPVYNYEAGLEKCFLQLSSWRESHPELKISVCFVNDGSRDQSMAMLISIASQNPDWVRVIDLEANRGKGAAVKAGFLALAPKCSQILFTDCDFYYGLDLIPTACKELDWCDIVILDRSLFSSYGQRAIYRRFASKAFNKLMCLLTGVSLFDTQAGFKAFRTDICLPLFENLQVERFAFDVELLAYATKYLLRIHSIPVVLSETRKKELQTSTIRLSTTFEVLKDIIRIAWIVNRPQSFDAQIKAKLQPRVKQVK